MEVGPNARGAAADPMTLRREYLRLFKVPLLLIVLGSVIYVACGLLIARDLTRAAFWISMSFSWDLAVIGLGMLVGSRLVDLESESTTTLLRQVAALVLAFSAIFWPIMWVTGGTLCGFTSAWCLATLLNVYLLSYFFELDSVEALQLTVILFAVRLAANFIWLTTVGTFGYLP